MVRRAVDLLDSSFDAEMIAKRVLPGHGALRLSYRPLHCCERWQTPRDRANIGNASTNSSIKSTRCGNRLMPLGMPRRNGAPSASVV